MANRLAGESSPYLQQHRHNPLDWYPWGEEAFARAKAEQKPIFLSIGYSSCHWCHVMEERVFEDEAIAQKSNKKFICIKVDREERPDIDKQYQNLYQIMSGGGGGWPLSIFLTHEMQPFYAATYIPPETFIQVIEYFAREYADNREELLQKARQIGGFERMLYKPKKSVRFARDFLPALKAQIEGMYDPDNGGFSGAPKFPRASLLGLCMQLGLKKQAQTSMELMAQGGLYDHVDGGFCRYSVDERWLVPHFEKMLYDNALLLERYVFAYLQSQNGFFLKIAEQTAAFLTQKMQAQNLFFSASDADSPDENGDKREGAYFTYGYKQLKEVLEAEVFKSLDVSRFGNFEGANIIRLSRGKLLDPQSRETLQQIRQKRSCPFIDKKIITAWNAMAISAFFTLGVIDQRSEKQAHESLQALLQTLYKEDKLYHCVLYGQDAAPSIEGFLEDYAYLVRALLRGYQVCLKPEYLQEAVILSQKAIAKFYANGRWFFSVDEVRVEADIYDASYPSSMAVMLDNLLTLGALGEDGFFEIVEKSVEFYSEFLAKNPAACATLSQVVIRLLDEETVIKANQSRLKAVQASLKGEQRLRYLFYDDGSDSFSLCGRRSCSGVFHSAEELAKRLREH